MFFVDNEDQVIVKLFVAEYPCVLLIHPGFQIILQITIP